MLTTWFKHEAKRVYAMLAESEEEQDQRRLVEWIRRKGVPVTSREVRQGCRWLKSPGAAEAALVELVKAGHGIWELSPEGTYAQRHPSDRLEVSTHKLLLRDSWGQIRDASSSRSPNVTGTCEVPVELFG